MADERLRLVAEVTDQFTAPLGRMETALRRTGNAARETAGQLKKDWEPFQGVLGRTTAALQGITSPLAALGAGSLAAGLSITGMATALRNFTTSTRDLSIMSKEVGLTVDQLRGLNRMGDEFGISADRMQGGVRTFAENMSQIRKRYGDAYMALQGMNMNELIEKLVSAPNMKSAMEAAAEEIGKLGDPVRGRRVAETLLGLPEFRAVASEFKDRFGRVWGETIADIGRIGPETEKAARDFEKSIGKIGDAAERLKLRILGPMAKGISGLIEDADKNGLGGSAEEQALKALVNPGGGPSARDRLEGRRNQVQRQLDLLNQNPAAPDFERKRDRMVEELRRVGDELEKLRAGGASAQQMSFSGPGGSGSLIHRAGFSGVGLPRGPLSGGGFPMLTDGDGTPVAGPRMAPGARSGSPTLPQAGPLAEGGAPRGNGVGTPRAARMGQMMGWAMDQLRREGVPEANLRQSAAHLVGQAFMESGLDPNKVHDQGTGLGIYGARDPKGWGEYPGARRSNMVRWLEANGYARNSAEGQMRYMVREAMGGGYPRTKGILMGQGSGDARLDTNAITKEFERPLVINDRYGAVANAFRTGPSDASSAGGEDSPWFNRPRSNEPGKMSRVRDDEIPVPGSGERPGDVLMRRMYGGSGAGGGMQIPGSPVQEHRMTIDFQNAPAGMKTSAKMGSLFKDTTVTKSRQLNGSVFA
ncbi:phage tail tip lysozyme [Methylobacterium dankookense]|uniref:Phage tail lysozyme domain-containing protein n=1 Tax=Methylobacterium dankookense TaxID=560405 RepID=A0A564G719_9HYPH|nr:phage tail tip lysozyme [Methylobacterium dankookense]GJD58355.1 hypothetical protein IFDJLNFL_4274 [Methylobacterium dankookense]VUF15640.1 hypothetical protein MTDSW087_05384 [Methylobacterium dankookense]